MQQIVDIARGYIGTAFHHQGRRPGVGLDCAGIVICAAWQAGIGIDDIEGYGERPEPQVLLRHLADQLVRVEVGSIAEAEPGTVDAFWIGSRSRVQHLQIITGEGTMIGVEQDGEVEERAIPQGWADRLHSVWRMP